MMMFYFSFIMMIPLLFYMDSFLLVLAGLTFLLLLCLMMNFNFFHFSLTMGWVGMDNLSFGMFLLSLLIVMLVIMSSLDDLFSVSKSSGFLLTLYMLLMSLLMCFGSCNLLGFYFFFEFSIIPTFLLVVGMGFQSERLQAGVYLLFYTLLASLPLFFSLMYMMNSVGSLFMSFIFKLVGFNYLYFGMVMGFLVKMPIYFLHLWLPKAHVEAPVSGSMVLAGILLKLGGYGLIRLLKCYSNFLFFNSLIISVSILGGMFVSLVCLRQTDMKMLVAYSSVSHMSLCIGGSLGGLLVGVKGCYSMMLAHGLCSSALFCLVNLVYKRSGSRSLLLNKGCLLISPSLSMLWFLLCSSNMSAPPSLGLFSEISIYISLVGLDYSFIIILVVMGVATGAYSLYLFSYSQHGKSLNIFYSFSYNFVSEYILVMMHWIPLNLLFLIGDYFYECI